MPTSNNVVKFPQKPHAADEENALWLVAVAACFKNTYSCEYHYERQQWEIQVKASTFQDANALVENCRCILGWGGTEAQK